MDDWPALAAARRHDPASRLPLVVGNSVAGSVAIADLHALKAWPQWLRIDAHGVHLLANALGGCRAWGVEAKIGPSEDSFCRVRRPLAVARGQEVGEKWTAADNLQPTHPEPDRLLDAALADINQTLRESGLVRAWRGELIDIVDPGTGRPLARTERAAARFWGTLTLGAHANGYVADGSGRPSRLWIARRSSDKATDPGMLDNLVGGGVGCGQTPVQALVREGWEEAGLRPELMAGARAGRVLRLRRNISEGLQWEDLHVFDLALPADWRPLNQDGEVAGFECVALERALELARQGEMTVDATLVTLDFAERHGLLPHAEAAAAAPALLALGRPR